MVLGAVTTGEEGGATVVTVTDGVEMAGAVVIGVVLRPAAWFKRFRAFNSFSGLIVTAGLTAGAGMDTIGAVVTGA